MGAVPSNQVKFYVEDSMEKRRSGKTGHMSTILAFGGAALWNASAAEAETGIELAVAHGINHVDVAPSYGKAELRLGPWLEKHHKDIFLACKTNKRSKIEAWEELKQSLERLRVDYFDLYQLHNVDDLETLYMVLGSEGALEAVEALTLESKVNRCKRKRPEDQARS